MLPLPLLLAVACSEWPRYDHLPEDTATRLPAGQDPASQWEVDWTSSPFVKEPYDDDPTALELETLAVGAGLNSRSELLGTGWNYTGYPERAVACDHTSAFPPTGKEPGFYTGDVDWRLMDVSPGVLCSGFFGDVPGTQIDVVPFEVDDCNLPVAPLLYADGKSAGRPVGFGESESTNEWAVVIDAPTRLAIAAAGWHPDDPENVQAYRWGLASLPPEAADDADLRCPLPPGVDEGGS